MKPDRIKALLPLVNSKVTGTRPGWVLGRCPFPWRHGGIDRNPSFAVSHDPKKKSRVKCLSCGYSGDLQDLMFDLSFQLKKNADYAHLYKLELAQSYVAGEFEEMELTAADIPEFEAPVDKNETLFPEQWLTTFKGIMHFASAVEYCLARGVGLDCLKALDVRYDPVQQRVCFPYRNFKGELMGLQGRYIGPEKCKDQLTAEGFANDSQEVVAAPLRYFQYGYHGKRNSHIWMGENMVNLDLPVVACEGPFDFAKLFMAYPNVVASFTTGLSMTKIKRLADADSIITYYDHGKGGDAARELIEKYLPKHPILHIIPTPEEGDPGAMEVSVLRDSLRDFVELP